MKHLSLFTGIGGFDLAAERAGIENVRQVEIDPFCRRVLAARWPHTSCWSDVREWQGDGHESFDLLTGGFPCQDLSVAGKRAGLAGERSGLFSEIIRIATAITPRWGVFENVPGLFSSRGGRDFAVVLTGLRQCWPVVGYRILDSQHFGVPQRRRRCFFVCGPTEAGVRAVLFEPEGGEGNPAAGGEAGEEVAATLRSRSHRPGVNTPGRGGEDDINLVVARALSSAKSGMRFDPNGEDYVVATLNSGGNSGGFRTEPGEHLVATLRSGGDVKRGWLNDADHGLVASPITAGYAKGAGVKDGHKGSPQNLLVGSSARRLTPLECERLQGFPDGWTCLCQPLEVYQDAPDDAATRCRCADSPRYRALGNAVTVNTVEWLLRRLMLFEGSSDVSR